VRRVSALCTYCQTDLIDSSDGSILISTTENSSSDSPAVLPGDCEQLQTRHMTLECTLQSLTVGSTDGTLQQQPAAAATAESTASTNNSSSSSSNNYSSRASVLQQPLPLHMAVVKPNGSEEHAAAIEQVCALVLESALLLPLRFACDAQAAHAPHCLHVKLPCCYFSRCVAVHQLFLDEQHSNGTAVLTALCARAVMHLRSLQALELSAGQLNSTAITLTLDSTTTSTTPWRVTPEFIAVLRAVLRDNLAVAGAHGPLPTSAARTLPATSSCSTTSNTAGSVSNADSVGTSDSPHSASSRRCHVCAAALRGASHPPHTSADHVNADNSSEAVSSSSSSSSSSRGFRCAACACVVCHSCLSAAAQVQSSVVALLCKDCADAAFPELAVRYRAAVRYAYGGDGPCMPLLLNLQVTCCTDCSICYRSTLYTTIEAYTLPASCSKHCCV
jgi:hypothetical protein